MKPSIITVKNLRINMNNVNCFKPVTDGCKEFGKFRIDIFFVNGAEFVIPCDSRDDVEDTLDLMDRACGNL